MKTVKEAREMRCCGPEGCGEIGPDGSRWCLASVCMAWRWQMRTKETVRSWDRPQGDGWWQSANHTYDTLPEWTREMPADEHKGYCGLASSPAQTIGKV